MICAPPIQAAPGTVDLMARERCDHCGQRAYVLVAVRTGATELPLAFCAHHFGVHETALTPRARLKVDVRENLTLREVAVHA